MMSSSRSGRVTPSRSVQVPAVSSAIAARIAAISSWQTWALPACGTATRCAPASGQRVPPTRWRAVSGWLDEPPLVDLLGDEAAEVGMHPPGDRQQDAAVGRHGGVLAEQPVEAGEAGGAGMRPLHHLRQLARVADQHDVAGAAPHGEQVGEPDLPGLVDDERVEGALELGAAEVEGGAADHVGAAPEAVVGPARSAHRRLRVVGIVAGPELVGDRDVLEGEARRVVRQRLEAGAQDVADRLVAGRGHRHPAAGSDEREDRPRRDVGLAGAGRSLDRQYALLQREDGAQRARDRVGPAEDVGGRPAVEPRRPAREQVVEGAEAARAALVGDRRAHRRREAARVERPRRMQRQPVGQLDAAAGADLHRGGAGLAVERGEPEGDVWLGRAARSARSRPSAGSPAPGSGSRGRPTASRSAPARSPRGRRGSRGCR